ncbi:ATP-binding cassette domain-containing protein [Anaerolineae bacterium CFX9]|nr:ATP-binding cassette domain-containing protein [Anaerolineae bacterium CFX9]
MEIEIRHIHKRFGSVHANNDISVTFPAGTIVGVLGENGAGKSTLMKILSGYQPADSGEIWVDGQLAAYRSPDKAIEHGIGMLQQDPLDIPAFTALENFVYGSPGSFVIRRRDARRRLEEVCARLGFEIDPETPIASLSIGQRQQLEIARLLALGARTLILDEPTTGISAEQKQTLFDALRVLAQRDGMSILLVSHKLEDVIALCDQVVVLRSGRLVGERRMPATTGELVSLMFGQELMPEARPDVALGDTTLVLERAVLKGKRFNVSVNLHARAGEVIGLAGLDGSGQELILRACVGLARLQQGRLLIGGVDMTGKSYRDFLHHGAAFGAAGRLEEGLIAGLTLTEHVALTQTQGALIRWGEARERTSGQLDLYNVKGTPESPIESLSGGNQQRVLMALLPPNPVLMALEQPTRGLDVDSARWIWTQLLARRAEGSIILFTSPDLDELVTYSDRILVLFAGRVHEIPDARQTTIDELGRMIGGHFEEKGGSAS